MARRLELALHQPRFKNEASFKTSGLAIHFQNPSKFLTSLSPHVVPQHSKKEHYLIPHAPQQNHLSQRTDLFTKQKKVAILSSRILDFGKSYGHD
ncbi:hypothetical protein JTE90_009461 [Oedothorax gibbosus]|uniref:Uncharacterized protein n=1 Tax=Oedothorax gibbosus TaxID=931172 RepID=A0AAV6VU76_9ARAC|nr:hypothetical protein JTE90_009461 [Oedothorax gibbosus]